MTSPLPDGEEFENCRMGLCDDDPNPPQARKAAPMSPLPDEREDNAEKNALALARTVLGRHKDQTATEIALAVALLRRSQDGRERALEILEEACLKIANGNGRNDLWKTIAREAYHKARTALRLHTGEPTHRGEK